MKSVLSSAASPTFTPGAANAGTLNFATAVASYGFQFGRLLGIINLTRNVILYTAGVSGYGGSWNSGTSVLTLAQATTGYASGDVLEIIWDDPAPGVALVAPAVGNSQGWSNKVKYITTASTNATSVKASSCTLGAITFQGPSSTLAYLKIYDKSSAPTVGTDTPFCVLQMSTAASYYSIPLLVLSIPGGIKLNNGLAFAVTALVADSDTTNAPANMIVNIFTN